MGNPAWGKGKSGNPKGRPKREICVPDILRAIGNEIDPNTKRTKLQELMRKVYEFAEAGESWAVNTILERTEGKVKDILAVESVDPTVEKARQLLDRP